LFTSKKQSNTNSNAPYYSENLTRQSIKRFPNRFDLVITDLRMREMLGTELARRLSTIRSGLPIVLITGHAQELNQQDLRAYGICCLLQKPTSLETLAESVYGALRMRPNSSPEANAAALELSI
jgi:FixJ family two-component response regulator